MNLRSSLRQIARPSFGLFAGVLACGMGAAGAQTTNGDPPKAQPQYLPVETRLLQDDLVELRVGITGVENAKERVDDLAICAAAQYALIRGYGFARHIRTKIDKVGGIWRADAVYIISPALPRGLQTINAQEAVADCKARDIPTI